MLEKYIREGLKQKDILLMTHIVLGHPSFDDSLRIVETMVEAGVDLMELQIPFSEPTADGPVIVGANQKALQYGTTVEKCFRTAEKITTGFDIPFLIMTYYNIPFTYGLDDFVARMADIRLRGAIIPDLPPEEGREYLDNMQKNSIDPILIFSPNTGTERMKYLEAHAAGFIYCVARKGVTGMETTFSNELASYLAQCRDATRLPLAVGFGIKEKADISYLKGKADIAVIGSQTIRLVEREGVQAVGGFIRGLR